MSAPEGDRAPPPPPRRLLREALDLARTLAIAAPPAVVAALAVAKPEGVQVGAGSIALALALSAIAAVSLRGSLARRLRTITAVLASYREGDFSIRARTTSGDELLADVLEELNQLGETLRSHRLGEMEAWALLRKVMSEVDVVVLAFDEKGRVRLANDAAARLLGRPGAALTGEDAASLGVAELLRGPAPRIVKDGEPQAHDAKEVNVAKPSEELKDDSKRPLYQGRPWELRRGGFRLAGEPCTLVVLSDVSAALRDNERDAWRRLIRVMGHEINNSLAPIQSISDTLRAQAARAPRADDWEQDVVDGLGVIARRSEALARFMASYASLARLPAPRLADVDVPALVRKVAALEQRVAVEIEPGPALVARADADQLEQVLINLVKNAADAAREKGGGVRARWRDEGARLAIEIEDDGPGVSDTANLFVPFFTTKQGGTGIGLVLSRQIVEAHGGELSLASRQGSAGALATIRLPAA